MEGACPVEAVVVREGGRPWRENDMCIYQYPDCCTCTHPMTWLLLQPLLQQSTPATDCLAMVPVSATCYSQWQTHTLQQRYPCTTHPT